jgi:hypothetical protein
MIDLQQVFDGTLGPTAGAAITVTRVSTNVIDWLVGRDMGAGAILGVHCDILQTFTAAGAATLVVDLEVCDTVGGAYLSILTTPVLPVAQLIAGSSIFRYGIPVNQLLNATNGILKAPGRFMRLNYTVATGPMTAGTVFAYVNPMLDRDTYTTYPGNYVAATTAAEV